MWTKEVGKVPTLTCFAWNVFRDGSANKPYILESAEDLYAFNAVAATDDYKTKCYRLGKDITLSSNDGESNWTPISVFAGSLDGDGHTISGIHVSGSTQKTGMFKVLTGATIKNLRIANSTFTNSNHYVGAIAGEGYGTFEKIHIADSVTVTVTNGKQSAGGILGQTSESGETTFTQCWNAGVVRNESGKYAGGLVSKVNNKITFTDCLNTGSVYAGGDYAGGFACWYKPIDASVASEMIRCVNAGEVSGGDSYYGSLLGMMDSGSTGMTITHCYNTKATAADFVGRRENLVSYATDKATDCILVSDLATEQFTNLDASVWKKQEGVLPTLKCFE